MLLGDISQVLQLILSGTGLLAIAFFLVWVFYPEKVEKWGILLSKLVAYFSEKHERRYISKHIEYNINSLRERLCEESSDILPYKVEVEWINTDEIESYLQGDNVLIVKMENHRNQSKNLAIAVKEYVPNALIPTARRYVEPLLMKAIDYVVSKEFLKRDTSAFTYFSEVVKVEQNTKDLVEKVDKINEQGYLTRILLSEYKKLGVLYPREPTPETYNETLDLESKVHALVTKKPKEKVSPEIRGKFIKAALVPVAREETVEKGGIEPHLAFIKNSINEGIKSFYVVAAGKTNIILAKTVVNNVERETDLKRVYEEEYTGIFREKKTKMYLGILEAENLT
jgi:hypothetical protein